MKLKIAAYAMLMLPMACNKHKDSSPPVVEPSPSPTPMPTPGIVLGLNGQPTAASVDWILPPFLQAQYYSAGNPSFVEAALELDLTSGEEKKSTKIKSGFSVKKCDSAVAIYGFLVDLGKEPAENGPSVMKSDVEEVGNWKGASNNFGGKILLKKSYKSGDETGIFRLDALFANEKSNECLLWNFVVRPVDEMSADYIEESAEYRQILDSLVATWKGVGVDFNN